MGQQKKSQLESLPPKWSSQKVSPGTQEVSHSKVDLKSRVLFQKNRETSRRFESLWVPPLCGHRARAAEQREAHRRGQRIQEPFLGSQNTWGYTKSNTGGGGNSARQLGQS